MVYSASCVKLEVLWHNTRRIFSSWQLWTTMRLAVVSLVEGRRGYRVSVIIEENRWEFWGAMLRIPVLCKARLTTKRFIAVGTDDELPFEFLS